MDINDDCAVDITDLGILASQWLIEYKFTDFAALAREWLTYGEIW
jgi:hypothetical protein